MFNSTILFAENGCGMSFLTSQLLQSFLLKDCHVVRTVDCGESASTVFDPRPDTRMVKAMHDICAQQNSTKKERSHTLPYYRAYLKHTRGK